MKKEHPKKSKTTETKCPVFSPTRQGPPTGRQSPPRQPWRPREARVRAAALALRQLLSWPVLSLRHLSVSSAFEMKKYKNAPQRVFSSSSAAVLHLVPAMSRMLSVPGLLPLSLLHPLWRAHRPISGSVTPHLSYLLMTTCELLPTVNTAALLDLSWEHFRLSRIQGWDSVSGQLQFTDLSPGLGHQRSLMHEKLTPTGRKKKTQRR